MGSWPSFNSFLGDAWGWGPQGSGLVASGYSNIVVGSNPLYTPTDFFGLCPNYGGKPTCLQGTLAQGSQTVTDVQASGEEVPLSSNAVGQFIIGPAGAVVGATGLTSWPYIATGTTVSDTSTEGRLSLSQAAVGSGTVNLNLYLQPIVPLPVLAAYIALASGSLMQARWQFSWAIGMMWFIQHFLVLYLRCNGDLNCTAGQVAAAGLKQGVTVSASAGNVSQSLEPVTGLEDWAAWNQTQPGVQFATMAKIIGMGPMLVW